MQNRQWRIVGLGDYHNYYSYFTYGILEGSIRCGAWFRPVPLFGQDLSVIEEQVLWFKPYIIFAHMIFNTRPHDREKVFDMLRVFKNKGIKIFYHAGDARTVPRYSGDISSFVTGVLLNSYMTDHFQNIWKVPCYHWPYSCLYQKDIGPVDDKYKCDVAFTGALDDSSEYHGERAQFVRELAKFVNVKIFPTPETGNTRLQTAELAASAKVVLGFGMKEEIPGYLDVRPYQYIGAGAVYFHTKSHAMRDIFSPGVHYVEFDKNNIKSAVEQILKIVNQRLRSEDGFRFCQKYHSTKERVQFVIDLVDGKADKPKWKIGELNYENI